MQPVLYSNCQRLRAPKCPIRNGDTPTFLPQGAGWEGEQVAGCTDWGIQDSHQLLHALLVFLSSTVCCRASR